MKQYNYVKPTIRDSFSFGWKIIFDKAFLPLMLAVIIAGLLNGPFGATWKAEDLNWFNLIWLFPAVMIGMGYALLFKPVIDYGERFLFLKAIREEQIELSMLFDGFKEKYLKIVVANLIVFALVLFGFILFIIPGFIVLIRLAFVPFLVMDKNLDPIKAIERSWIMTRGYGWKILGMGILSFFILIAGILVFVAGVIFSFMWIHAAFATLYQTIQLHNDMDNPIPILTVHEG